MAIAAKAPGSKTSPSPYRCRGRGDVPGRGTNLELRFRYPKNRRARNHRDLIAQGNKEESGEIVAEFGPRSCRAETKACLALIVQGLAVLVCAVPCFIAVRVAGNQSYLTTPSPTQRIAAIKTAGEILSGNTIGAPQSANSARRLETGGVVRAPREKPVSALGAVLGPIETFRSPHSCSRGRDDEPLGHLAFLVNDVHGAGCADRRSVASRRGSCEFGGQRRSVLLPHAKRREDRRPGPVSPGHRRRM